MNFAVMAFHQKEKTMKIYVIAIQTPGEETPWIVNAWDEWTVDENPTGFNDLVEDTQFKNPGADVRIGIVEVPDSFLFDIFKPVTAKGTIVPPPCKDDQGGFSSADEMEYPKSEGGIGA